MASIQIPNLPAVTGLTGAELFEGVQAGTSVKISLDQIIAAVYGNDPLEFPIPVYLGGTGLSTFTVGDIMYASATQTLSKLADVATGNAIISGGVGAAPSYGKIGLTTHVSGVLPVANGGTGVTTSTGTGSVVLSNNPAFTGQASFADGTAAAPSIAHTGDLNTGILFPAANTVAVTTAGTEAMRIDASGNVGIGGTPATQLDLAANNTAGTALNVLRFTDTDLSATAPQELGKIEFYSADNSAPGAGVKASITGIAEVGNPGGGIAFSTDLLTGTPIERMRVDRFGNVGIGTTSPLAKVHSQVNTFTTADMVAYKAYNNQAVGVYANFQNSATGTAITNGFLIGINDSEDVVLSNYESTNMLFLTSATERMRINSSGNVGIGKTNPAYSLEVVSDISASGFATFGRLVLRSAEGTVTAPTQITASTILGVLDFTGNNATPNSYNTIASIRGVSDGAITSTSSPGYLTFRTTPSGTVTTVERMRIDASGNVGIGTGSPNGLLELSSAAPSLYFRESDQAVDEKMWRLAPAGSTLFLQAVSDDNSTAVDAYAIGRTGTAINFQLWKTGGSERMRITSSGNVGIGKTNPAYSLEVVSDISASGFATFGRLILRSAEGTVTAPTQITASTILGVLDFTGNNATPASYNTIASIRGVSDGAITSTSSPGYLTFRTTPSGTVTTVEAMRITSSGNVGIGNSAPVTPLHVTGASMTTGVVYKAQPAQTSKAAAATLTIAELLTGIIQYTGAAATLTLPTGTSIEGGLPATFPTDMSFDVSFINTGAALLTIGANGNTTVGTMTVATVTSALLRFRKTAANTYTVYRIS